MMMLSNNATAIVLFHFWLEHGIVLVLLHNLLDIGINFYSFLFFIGLTFAMMNMTIVLAILVRKFKFYTSYKSPEEIELELSITTKCVKGVPLRAELRKT